jgi:predicted N-acetyltransferase YhbS
VPTIADAVYPREELPRDLEVQVLAFLRMEYPDAFRGEERFRDRLWDGTIHFVRAAGDVLVSHAMVIPIEVSPDGVPIRIAGVASVLTYPQFRHEGHGSGVMRVAGDHIRRSDLGPGMLFCGRPLQPFYARLGWQPLEPGRVLVEGREPDDVVMTLGEPRLPDVLRLDWSW